MKSAVYKVKKFLKIFIKGIKFLWREYHFLVPPLLWKKYYIELKNKLSNKNIFYNPFDKSEYLEWLKEQTEDEEIIELKYKPLISVIIPVYNAKGSYLRECLDSVLNQTYENFEICIADDKSTNNDTISVLKEYEKKTDKIKIIYREENGHISNASNSAISLAKGEFIALLDNDDIIEKNALYEFVKVLNEDKKTDMIYTDEDKIDLKGNRCEPNLKPDWAPDTLLSYNYICHFTLLRKSIVNELDGFRVGYEGAQDYDLFLRFTEKTQRIKHIPKILYHWRMSESSTAKQSSNKSYAYERGRKALLDALNRRGINAEVKSCDKVPFYIIEYKFKKQPLISIIIPTKDKSDILDKCINSIYDKTTYKNFEIIIVNNNSVEEATFELFEKYKKKYKNIKILDINTEFNYSHLNNEAVKKANGEYILLLNNDTEVITENWLEIMAGYAMQSHIGAVGCKLLYPNNTIQHGGVVIGLGGVASHTHISRDRNYTGVFGNLVVPTNYSAVTAACLMVSKAKFLEVNGLEEKLKVAYNDIDFNLKLLDKGYYNVFIPQVELYHYESLSRGLDTTSEKYKRFLEESNFMYTKWKIKETKDKYYNPNYSLKGSFLLEKRK